MEFEDDIDALYATYQSLLPMKEVDSARLWQKFRLDWNYNSNRIEGNTLTRGETKELLEQGIKPVRMRKDILQMQSHDKAIDFLRELAESDTPLTEVDIRALHKTALGENYWTEAITADGTITRREIEIGVYKKRPNIVLKSDGSEHVYAAPQEVPARMAVTIKRLREYLKKPDVALHDYLAELHQDFIQTHPFDDGNGRVVRLLLNYVCLHLKWPPVIIKSNKRPEYIASLESWNDGNEKPFRELMKRELIWSLKKSNEAARGENIEDPDDLNKEVDWFVRETAQDFYKPIKNESHIVGVFKTAILPILEGLDVSIPKFTTLFTSYIGDQKETLAIEHLIEENKVHDLIHKGIFEAFYFLGSMNFEPYPLDIDITIRVNFLDNKYVLKGYINENKLGFNELQKILKDAQFKTDFLFVGNAYDEPVPKVNIQRFCDEITRGIMSEIKYYKDVSYVK